MVPPQSLRTETGQHSFSGSQIISELTPEPGPLRQHKAPLPWIQEAEEKTRCARGAGQHPGEKELGWLLTQLGFSEPDS